MGNVPVVGWLGNTRIRRAVRKVIDDELRRRRSAHAGFTVKPMHTRRDWEEFRFEFWI